MTSRDKQGTDALESPRAVPAAAENGNQGLVEPDLDFIRSLSHRGGESLKKCFQCGTCSGTCALSPDRKPFPRKEMAWALWGMKERLVGDPDIWLCHQCNDCSTICPRDARPGDVLAAIRQESVVHYAVPRFLARWASQPCCIPLLLGIPAALLTGVLLLKVPLEKVLGISNPSGERIVYSYSSMLPHWLLNSFFGLLSFLVLLAVVAGVVRFWREMTAAAVRDGIAAPAKGLFASIVAALRSIFTHEKFSMCTKTYSRSFSHLSVFFGFLALCLVTIWVITARYNPLIQDAFIYPFSFWNPWKMLANLGGAAIAGGCLWMIIDRLRNSEQAGAGTYPDWALIVTLLVVVITGLIAEVLHYVRLDSYRHVAYFIHLVFVCALLMYLPYCRFAHVVYRTTAIVFAEHYGLGSAAGPAPAAQSENLDRKEDDHGEEGSR